jgi:ribosome biogenesis GTPase
VARVDFGSCVLLLDDGTLVAAHARGRLMGPRKSLGNAMVVGDRVHCVGDAATAKGTHDVLVAEVEPRRNAFSRRASGKRAVEQVVAANLDQVVLVAAIADPPFSRGLADRVFCQAEYAGLPARLVLNKMDLSVGSDHSDAQTILDDYERAGVPGHRVCAKSRDGIAPLRDACLGQRSLFVGHSGVGKSTLLNALVPGLDLLEGAVNAKTGKGRHTTSAAVLVRPEPGFELIDTPGVRAFAPWGVGPDDLDHAYHEFAPFLGRCKFGDCRHTGEPGCAVATAAEQSVIAPRRLASYRRLREELSAEFAGF